MEFDEFGNVIGGEDEDEDDYYTEEQTVPMEEEEEPTRSIVLHEDKQYYPSAASVYPGAVTAVMEEDAQPLEEPILKPVTVRLFSKVDSPPKTYSDEFLTGLLARPELARNVAIIGPLHSGKTVLCDMLVQQAHDVDTERYTDARNDEQAREMSVKATPASLVLQDSRSKSYLVTVMDCPGHVNFMDEVTASLRLADGAVIVVDALEGLTRSAERLIKMALDEGVALSVVVNKVDRLILELKLPPSDAYLKLASVVDEVNVCVEELWLNREGEPPFVDPRDGTVCFASSLHAWCFTLESFAIKYGNRELGSRLWGDLYYDERTKRFSKTAPPSSEFNSSEDDPLSSAPRRSFVFFVLEPLYKLYSHALGEEPKGLSAVLAELGIKLKSDELALDPKPLLKAVFRQFFKDPCAFVDMVSRVVPSAADASRVKLERYYAGELNDLVVHVAKMYSTADASSFAALGRVYCGSLRPGARVEVRGEAYSEEDTEDARVCVVEGIAIPHGRHATDVKIAGPGNIVLITGVDSAVRKTATITNVDAPFGGFKPLKFSNAAIIKVAVEPMNPADLPKMTEGLRKIAKSYPLAETKVEESGEHVIAGTGELYMDCIMHDLREMYARVEIKVADPVVAFRETVSETSSFKCYSETPNKRNKLTMIAEPLDAGVADDVEAGIVDATWPQRQLGAAFQARYDWDLLASRSIWAFGPDPHSYAGTVGCSCLLLDDTLPSEVDKRLLFSTKEPIVQGFQWGCREGPLCDEPMRGVKFKILDAAIADQPLHRGAGQIIPTARRVAYSSFLMAAPRLMEPVFACEIACPADCVSAVFPVLARRRGHVVRDAPKPGAPFYLVDAFLPAIDSFGFETDLRAYTNGQAMCSLVFDHFQICPGDPLDRSIILHPLEPSPPPHLAREFMVKTRRRKGLSEDVTIAKYFDDPLLRELAAAAAASA